MKHKYQLIIEFETDKPVKKIADRLLQFENGLTYFTSGDINNSFIYGTGKTKLKKIYNK